MIDRFTDEQLHALRTVGYFDEEIDGLTIRFRRDWSYAVQVLNEGTPEYGIYCGHFGKEVYEIEIEKQLLRQYNVVKALGRAGLETFGVHYLRDKRGNWVYPLHNGNN